MLPFLDEERVRGLLGMEDLIPAMERTLIDLSAGSVAQPARQVLAVEPYGGYFGAMPAVSQSAMYAKLVTFYPDNAARGLATHLALIVLFSPRDRRTLADDGRSPDHRDAHPSAPDARVLAIIGSRVQARSHVDVLRRQSAFT